MRPTFFLSRLNPEGWAWVVDPKCQASTLEKIRKIAHRYADEHKVVVRIHWNLTTNIVQTVEPHLASEVEN